MALFSRKTEDKKKVEKTPEVKAVKKTSGEPAPLRKDTLQGVLVRPHITEKATLLAEKSNVYVFEINENASKPIIAKTIQSLYNVIPEKVRIVRNPGKTVFVRGKVGSKAGVKKAYIYLKKGEKIEFA